MLLRKESVFWTKAEMQSPKHTFLIEKINIIFISKHYTNFYKKHTFFYNKKFYIKNTFIIKI